MAQPFNIFSSFQSTSGTSTPQLGDQPPEFFHAVSQSSDLLSPQPHITVSPTDDYYSPPGNLFAFGLAPTTTTATTPPPTNAVNSLLTAFNAADVAAAEIASAVDQAAITSAIGTLDIVSDLSDAAVNADAATISAMDEATRAAAATANTLFASSPSALAANGRALSFGERALQLPLFEEEEEEIVEQGVVGYPPAGSLTEYQVADGYPPVELSAQHPVGLPVQYPAGLPTQYLAQYPVGPFVQYPAGPPAQYSAGFPEQYPAEPAAEVSLGESLESYYSYTQPTAPASLTTTTALVGGLSPYSSAYGEWNTTNPITTTAEEVDEVLQAGSRIGGDAIALGSPIEARPVPLIFPWARTISSRGAEAMLSSYTGGSAPSLLTNEEPPESTTETAASSLLLPLSPSYAAALARAPQQEQKQEEKTEPAPLRSSSEAFGPIVHPPPPLSSLITAETSEIASDVPVDMLLAADAGVSLQDYYGLSADTPTPVLPSSALAPLPTSTFLAASSSSATASGAPRVRVRQPTAAPKAAAKSRKRTQPSTARVIPTEATKAPRRSTYASRRAAESTTEASAVPRGLGWAPIRILPAKPYI